MLYQLSYILTPNECELECVFDPFGRWGMNVNKHALPLIDFKTFQLVEFPGGKSHEIHTCLATHPGNATLVPHAYVSE